MKLKYHKIRKHHANKQKEAKKKERKGTTIASRAWNAQTMIESQNVDVLNQEEDLVDLFTNKLNADRI